MRRKRGEEEPRKVVNMHLEVEGECPGAPLKRLEDAEHSAQSLCDRSEFARSARSTMQTYD